MGVKAVVFDAFGTVVQIQRPLHPFRQILKEGIRQGRRPKPDDIHDLMTQNLSLRAAADKFGIEIDQDKWGVIQRALDEELESIQPYPDGQKAIELLQREGLHVGVCSNLAMPYGAAVRRLYPGLDAYGFSYEIGAMKPDPVIYKATCKLLGSTTSQVAMIGDSQKCDRDGPRALGIKGFFLDRQGGGERAFKDLVTFARFVLIGMSEK